MVFNDLKYLSLAADSYRLNVTNLIPLWIAFFYISLFYCITYLVRNHLIYNFWFCIDAKGIK